MKKKRKSARWRSKAQDEGRPPRFGTRMVQTTVRFPEEVLTYLKDHYGVLQRAIDALLIIPALREMAERQKDDECNDDA